LVTITIVSIQASLTHMRMWRTEIPSSVQPTRQTIIQLPVLGLPAKFQKIKCPWSGTHYTQAWPHEKSMCDFGDRWCHIPERDRYQKLKPYHHSEVPYHSEVQKPQRSWNVGQQPSTRNSDGASKLARVNRWCHIHKRDILPPSPNIYRLRFPKNNFD
jgi:hypothetical protein